MLFPERVQAVAERYGLKVTALISMLGGMVRREDDPTDGVLLQGDATDAEIVEALRALWGDEMPDRPEDRE